MINVKYEAERHRAAAYDTEKKNTLIGVCTYSIHDEIWTIDHTEVINGYEGQGIARQLVDTIIEEAASQNISLKSVCSYATRVLEKRKIICS